MMAKIGLIDVDGHRFPNVPLMKISAYHKSMGDTVEWVYPFDRYDKIYQSKTFSFTPDINVCLQCDEVVKGGSGYAISINNGKEEYDKEKDIDLPNCIEKQCPDYSIYPQISEAYGHCTRGCPRGCAFCIIAKKEGRRARQVADVKDFWRGQREIKLMDANLLAAKEREDILVQLAETKAKIDFTQGLDIRLTEGIVPLINNLRIKCIHFAWDNAKQDLTRYFQQFKKEFKSKDSKKTAVYVLTNFDTSEEEDLWRVYKLKEMGYDPYVMIYDKEHAAGEKKKLQRYVNNKRIFGSIASFEEYDQRKG